MRLRLKPVLGNIKGRNIDTTTPIFETHNIERITLYRLPDHPNGIEVPSEYLEEITSWLGTFTVYKEAEEAQSGINMFTFRIEYSDGTVVTSGVDTTTIDGVIYDMKKGSAPYCINELFKANSTEE